MLTGTTSSPSPLWSGQFSGPPTAQPQPTPDQPTPDQWVPPITKARDPDAALSHGQPPQTFWRLIGGGVDPATHVAPPSIMQIRITQLLNDQAPENAPDTVNEVEDTTAELTQRPDERGAETLGIQRVDAAEDTPNLDTAARPEATSAAMAALEDRAPIANLPPAEPETLAQL